MGQEAFYQSGSFCPLGCVAHLLQILVCPPQMFPSTPQLVVEKVVVLTTEGTFPRLRMREGQTSKPQGNHMPGMVDEVLITWP